MVEIFITLFLQNIFKIIGYKISNIKLVKLNGSMKFKQMNRKNIKHSSIFVFFEYYLFSCIMHNICSFEFFKNDFLQEAIHIKIFLNPILNLMVLNQYIVVFRTIFKKL